MLTFSMLTDLARSHGGQQEPGCWLSDLEVLHAVFTGRLPFIVRVGSLLMRCVPRGMASCRTLLFCIKWRSRLRYTNHGHLAGLTASRNSRKMISINCCLVIMKTDSEAYPRQKRLWVNHLHTVGKLKVSNLNPGADGPQLVLVQSGTAMERLRGCSLY